MAIVSDILIVDDDPVNVQIIANALVKTNSVRIATSGLKGVEVAQEIIPDLICSTLGCLTYLVMKCVRCLRAIPSHDISLSFL